MASSNFKLRVNPSGKCKIYLHFNYGRKQVYRYSLKYSLDDKSYWDKNKQRVKVTPKVSNAEEINSYLAQLDEYSDILLRKYSTNEYSNLTNDYIGRELNELIEGKKESQIKDQSFINFFNWFLSYYSTNPRPRINKPYKKGTLKSLKNTRNLLINFQKKYKVLEFNDINLDFHQSLLKYLTKNEYSTNYKGTVIKNIITVVNDAYERDYHQNLDFRKSNFTKPREKVNHIYLSEEEIEQIEDLDLSTILANPQEYFKNQTTPIPSLDLLTRVREFFLVAYYTGLRIEDVLDLDSQNVEMISTQNGDFNILRVDTEKTKLLIEIPIKRKLQKIIDKYNGNFPPKVSAQKINLYIKIIGKAANIINLHKENTSRKPKYEQITNHTARRSFCTNAYKNGMHTLDIMSISGHKSEKVFLNYIKATPRDRLNQIKDHPFFK